MSERHNDQNKQERSPGSEEKYLNETYDRYATIEFTEEDLRKIRRPNPQPLDSDYFAVEQRLDTQPQASYSQEGEGNNLADRSYTDTPEASQVENEGLIEDRDQTNEPHMDLTFKTPNAYQEEAQEEPQEEEITYVISHSTTEPETEDNLAEDDLIQEELETTSTEKYFDRSEVEPFDPEDSLENYDLPTELTFYDRKVEREEVDHQDIDLAEYKDSANQLEETLPMDIEEDVYQRHHFEEESSTERSNSNPFEYRSIENQLRDEQNQKRVANVKPSFFKRIMQSVFSTREDLEETEYYSDEEDEVFYSDTSHEEGELNLSELGDHPVSATDTEVLESDSSNFRIRRTEDDSDEAYLDQEVSETSSFDGENNHVQDAPLYVEEYEVEDREGMMAEEEYPQVDQVISSDELTEDQYQDEDIRITTDSKVEERESQIEDQVIRPARTELEDEWEDSASEEDLATYQEFEQDDEDTSYSEEQSNGSSSEVWQNLTEKGSTMWSKTKDSLGQLAARMPSKKDRSEEKAAYQDEISLKEGPDVFYEYRMSDAKEVVPEDFDPENQSLGDKVSQRTAHYHEPILTDAIIESAMRQQEMTEDTDQSIEADKEASRNFVSGTAWLSFGKIFSRIIGALYVIPWATWLGAEYTQANTLYTVGYKPYSLFLAIATAGFPSAVAKQMAYYNTKKEFKVADKLFRNSMLIMLISGVISAGLMFLLAPVLANQSATDNPEAATTIIRTLAPALLILPAMSLIRGYFQGLNDMVPTAISEVLEQIVRVIYMLVATYAIMTIYQGNATYAVAHSTFAAFVGALASLIYLIICYLRHLPQLKQLKAESRDRLDVDFKESLRLMLIDSIPFVLLGGGIIIVQNIDTYTFKQILIRTTVLMSNEISELFGAMSLDVDKLVMIIIAISVAIATSSIPAVSAKFSEGDVNKTGELIKDIVLVFAFIMLPASVGMAAIANNLYPFFYPAGYSEGPALLVTGSFMSITLGTYTVFSAILQSMNYRRQAVSYLVVGIVVKLILQFPMVALFQAHGAMLATMIGFGVSSVMMWMKIWRAIKIRDRYFVGDLVRILIGTVVMGIGAVAWNRAMNAMMDPAGRGLTFLQIIIVVIMAMILYLGVMSLFGMMSILIGDYQSELQERLSINK
ncbi:oligosaccharide flippase family protein [Facklamia lactis]|uniref:oligosaccharide flippase family protein n=1 Tax=Facklamia lactis TaxID=2749967 RepID=UPI0018CF83D7|nr:polysaccharide biosynthesis protein [Facklamia lactis]MBG9981247.1 oligosaccharide flippase family protein [Facklamia lactis]